ncbi:MAG: hypothetical protein ACKO2C_08300 [Actinomycetes bacterium]
MPQRPDLSRFIDAGTGFVDLTRAQARARARELVDQGLIAQSQVQALVDGLLEESRRRRDLALATVRTEVGRQVKALGLVTRAELTQVEQRLRRELGAGGSKSKKAAAKKTAGKKATAKKTAGKQAATKKAAAKKTAGKKAPAKRKAAGSSKRAS